MPQVRVKKAGKIGRGCDLSLSFFFSPLQRHVLWGPLTWVKYLRNRVLPNKLHIVTQPSVPFWEITNEFILFILTTRLQSIAMPSAEINLEY